MAKKTKAKGKKAKVGRPTKYSNKFCNELILFFAKDPYREETETTTYANGATKESYKEVPNDMPLFQCFAHKLGVHVDTLHEWKEKHPEFSEAYKKAKGLQEAFLVQNALRGNFVSPFSIFTAKNILGWRDVQVVEQTSTLTYQELESPKPKAASPEEARKAAKEK